MKAGLDELTERMPRKAITAQQSGHASGLPVVMAAVFITSFPSTAAKQQIRLASDRGRVGGREGGRVGMAEGVKCQRAAEGRLRKGPGQMSRKRC